VIVTMQGLGDAARVWLTFNGAIKTTVVMTDGETGTMHPLYHPGRRESPQRKPGLHAGADLHRPRATHAA
jgi:hypothetical protein